MSNRNFQQLLNEFITSRDRTKTLAIEVSNVALEHFANTGDVCHLQSFYDAMEKNYDRPVAFVKWAMAHGPIDWVAGKFSKDKSEERLAKFKDGVGQSVKCHLVQAEAKPYFEFAPAKEAVEFSSDDLISKLQALIKRHENADRFKPKDEQAANKLKQIKQAVAGITTAQAPAKDDNEDTISEAA